MPIRLLAVIVRNATFVVVVSRFHTDDDSNISAGIAVHLIKFFARLVIDYEEWRAEPQRRSEKRGRA